MYEVEYPNGHKASLTANAITENMFAQVNGEGNCYVLFEDITLENLYLLHVVTLFFAIPPSKDPITTTGRNSLVSFDISAALSTYQWLSVPIPSPFPSGGLTVHTLHIQICVARLEVVCL
jgi:hypothetical protein